MDSDWKGCVCGWPMTGGGRDRADLGWKGRGFAGGAKMCGGDNCCCPGDAGVVENYGRVIKSGRGQAAAAADARGDDC